MPVGGSSYLAAVATMGGRRSSFAYHKLKKLPPAAAPPPTTTAAAAVFELQDHHQDQQLPSPSAAAIEDSYRSYYRALGAAVARGRQRRRLRRPPLRISGLARALRRRAAAVGGRVRASVARVARRLKEGRPYIADLFAGNYMFMQVAPSPTIMLDGKDGSFAPFTEYYYAKGGGRLRPPAALPVHRAAASAAAAGRGVMYRV